MATAFDSSTSSPADMPFHDDPFLSFADGSSSGADNVHVFGGGGDDFPASPDSYAFRHDSAAAHPFGIPGSNGNGSMMRASSPTPAPSSSTPSIWGITRDSSTSSDVGDCGKYEDPPVLADPV
ncbi:hypothetical protein ZWY2020_059211 [Hordeum vulgare]|nr:hypothetical protein ZWY2020_059211 [Hordeum vulgare]